MRPWFVVMYPVVAAFAVGAAVPMTRHEVRQFAE